MNSPEFNPGMVASEFGLAHIAALTFVLVAINMKRLEFPIRYMGDVMIVTQGDIDHSSTQNNSELFHLF